MISVNEAQNRLLNLVQPMQSEPVMLTNAQGRILAASVISQTSQPPFNASAMDGYAIQRKDYRKTAQLRVVGSAAAGTPFDGKVQSGEAVRIFTGGVIPDGADFVLIQENVERDGKMVRIADADQSQNYIRKAGQDFEIGSQISAQQALTPALISQIASMGYGDVTCHKQPSIAVISTGDELIPPGSELAKGEIFASNSYGLKAAIGRYGADVHILPIARDTEQSLREIFALALSCDLIITSGGASVGDHDLVMPVAQSLGLKADFHKVKMRPGKPLMAGRFKNGPAFVGLPGNPVSALVCAEIFIAPMIRKMLGLSQMVTVPLQAVLSEEIAANGNREHYMRGQFWHEGGTLKALPFGRQDSALMSVLSSANCLIRRQPNESAQAAGALIDIITLENI